MCRTISIIKLLAFLILLLPTVAFALTDKRVDAKNGATLEASLNSMLSDLSLRDQIKLMTAFFDAAYVTSKNDIPYAIAQRRLFVHRLSPNQYAATSATAFVADGRMDSLDPTEAYAVFKFDGWSKKESYIRFILAFGEAVDGLSGHEIMTASAKAASTNVAALLEAKSADLKKKRKRFIADLQRAEIKNGACQNIPQQIARGNISRIGEAIQLLESGEDADFSQYPNSGLRKAKCRGFEKVARYGENSVDTRVSPTDTLYASAMELMSLINIRSLVINSQNSAFAQLEARMDVSLDEPENVDVINFQVILIPKRGRGQHLYFRGRLPALGGYGGMSSENLQLFSTLKRPKGKGINKDDYSAHIVVTEIKFKNGKKKRYVASLRDFQDWAKHQSFQ